MPGSNAWTAVPIGEDRVLAVVAGEAGIREIRFEPAPPEGAIRNDQWPVLKSAAEQLRAYFAGELKEFSLPLDWTGTPFQISVWRALLGIPYGETRSYGQVAAEIGAPKAVRAVGAANGRNPIPIVVPCHRVIGGNGKLTGFGGGLPLKRFLLDLESGQLPVTSS